MVRWAGDEWFKLYAHPSLQLTLTTKHGNGWRLTFDWQIESMVSVHVTACTGKLVC